MARRLPLLLLLGICAAYCAADGFDEVIRDEMKKQNIPGICATVVRDGKIIRQGAYGFADLELLAPATTNSVFEIGSMTKQFTASLIMLLVEGGKVNLDERVGKYISEAPETWKGVTIRHLLTHTSGIPNYTNGIVFLSLSRNDYQTEKVYAMFAGRPLDFAPGEKWEYSNSNYYLLGMIIERVTGEDYWTFLNRRILQPLEMNHTRSTDPKTIIPGRVRGYLPAGEKLLNADPLTPSAGWAAGSLVSTIGDLAKWDAALYKNEPIKQSLLQQMWTPAKLNDSKSTAYGFGWGVDMHRKHKNVSHGGGTVGFSTFISRYPDDKITVVVLTNRGFANAGAIARRIAELYIPGLAEDKEPQVTQTLRTALEDIIAGKPQENMYGAEYWKEVYPDRLRTAAAFLSMQGKLQKLELLERSERGENRVYRYRVVFERVTLNAALVLNKEGKIVGFALTM